MEGGESYQKLVINVHEEVVLGPFQAVGVERLRVIRSAKVVLSTRAPERVCFRRWSPVESGDDRVPTVGVVVRAVSSALSDIDLATHGPAAVDILFGHHPNGRPEPVTFWHLCNDLDLAILDAPLAFRGHASTTNRVDDVTRGLIAIDGAHRIVL